MKKLLSVLLLFAFLFTVSVGYADDRDLTNKGIHELEAFTGATATGDKILVYDASDGNVKTVSATTGPTYSGDITFWTNLIGVGRVNAYSTIASSSTPILPSSLPYSVILKYVGAAASLDNTPGSTLPNGTPGKVLVLKVVALLSGGTWVVTPTTSLSVSTITFDTIGDFVTLLYVDDTMGWIILSNNGCTIVTPAYAGGR
jgi:hypothetical protein